MTAITRQQAVAAHDAYWHVKETGGPPPFDSQPPKLQQCWAAAALAVAAAERERCARLAARAAAEWPPGTLVHGALSNLAADLLREQP